MLRVLIAADMEGISGVVHWDQVDPEKPDYSRFRHIMTAEVNAALKGAIQTGADEILVADGHDTHRNILIEELDPRARLIAGRDDTYGMVSGIDNKINAAMFVGFHARAGTRCAILDHTWSGVVNNLWLNGRLVGEFGLSAALCGYFDVPVIMVSGDQAVGAEASELINGVEVAVVKQARGRFNAELLPLEVSFQKVREAAARAISRVRADMAPPPYKLQPPVIVVVEFRTSDLADKAGQTMGAERLDGRRIQCTAEDMLTAFRFFTTAVNAASN